MIPVHNGVDFSRFGKSFQENLCRIVLDDREFCDQLGEVVKTEFFELKYLQVFTDKIFEYKREYSTHPSREIFASVLRTGIDDETDVTRKQIRDFFARIISSDPDFDADGYIKKMSLDFCRKQNLKEAMIKSAKLLQSSSFEEISTIINEALKLGSDNDFGYDYHVDFERRFETKQRNTISTGWPQIDQLCRGGLGKSELGVVIAPTGAGKSMTLVHLASQALKTGKTVIYYTMEMEDASIASRFDSCITGIPISELREFKQQILEKVKGIEGSLIVKEYPTKQASTETIKNHLSRMKARGIKPDMIIVDYADLLRPVRFKREKRQELEEIYEELRGLAKTNECCLWTASQTNRSGLNAEVITMESISEAFNKCFVADFIFSLSRTMEDKVNNTGRFFIAKNRAGIDGLVFPIFMDPSNVNISVINQEALNPNDVIKNAAKRQEELLREKYKQFKNGEEK
jgi:replicative DNA helicase